MSVSPARILETFHGYQKGAALRAALELDLFTALDPGPAGTAELARSSGASERGLRILCDYLTVLGFLEKDASAGTYRLLPDSAAFLSRRSDRYLGGAVASYMRIGEYYPPLVPFTTAVLAWLSVFLREPRLWVLLPIRRRS